MSQGSVWPLGMGFPGFSPGMLRNREILCAVSGESQPMSAGPPSPVLLSPGVHSFHSLIVVQETRDSWDAQGSVCVSVSAPRTPTLPPGIRSSCCRAPCPSQFCDRQKSVLCPVSECHMPTSESACGFTHVFTASLSLSMQLSMSPHHLSLCAFAFSLWILPTRISPGPPMWRAVLP